MSVRRDFEWVYTDEPHATRRREILSKNLKIEKYPQIKKLFGHDPRFKWVVVILVIFQILTLFHVKDLSWPLFLLSAYFVGGVINHSLMLAIHETAHSMAFGPHKPLLNKYFGIFANLPIPFPFSVTFKYYHLQHHRYQGDEIYDTDIPTSLEAELFSTTRGKLIWVFLQPFFYALRPLFVHPKLLNAFEIFNIVVQLFFDYFVYKYFGGFALMYLAIGCFLSMGLHPMAGHFISEHYMFKKGFETYSYYGILNWITFNVGYHNEHHDFPNIPGWRLPLVSRIAPEYYNNLPKHDYWSKVIYDFITDPAVGLYARIKRKHRESADINRNS